MRRSLALLFLCLVVSLVAADDSGVYIRNRPFKGLVLGSGATMLIEVQPLVEALGLSISETADGGLVVGSPPDPNASCGAGSILIGGRLMPVTKDSSSALMVELGAFCAAAGATVKPNKSLGTVDIYPNAAGGDGRATAPAKVGKDATPTQVVQGFFAAMRILEPLPPSTDLLPFYKDPDRFLRSLELCHANFRPLITAAAGQGLGESLSGMRANLQKLKGLMRTTHTAEDERKLEVLLRNPEFVREWRVLGRLWDGMRLADVTVHGEEIRGDRATVDATVTLGSLLKTRTPVELIQEEGRWKLARSPAPEAGVRQPQETPSSPTAPTRPRPSQPYRPRPRSY